MRSSGTELAALVDGLDNIGEIPDPIDRDIVRVLLDCLVVGALFIERIRGKLVHGLLGKCNPY